MVMQAEAHQEQRTSDDPLVTADESV